MKKFLAICILVVGIIILIASNMVGGSIVNSDEQLFRIHIRANSNITLDQNIKYRIKDEIVQFFIPKIANVSSAKEAENIVSSCLGEVNRICDEVLSSNGFDYSADSYIANEYFPDRCYEGYIVESGYYDALIIELGEANGDNWWCVIYPPLCFVNASGNDSNNIVYKSKILEIIREFFN